MAKKTIEEILNNLNGSNLPYIADCIIELLEQKTNEFFKHYSVEETIYKMESEKKTKLKKLIIRILSYPPGVLQEILDRDCYNQICDLGYYPDDSQAKIDKDCVNCGKAKWEHTKIKSQIHDLPKGDRLK